MTVKQLIDELSKFPPEMEVVDIDCLIIEEVRADKIAVPRSNPAGLFDGKVDVVRLL